MNEKTVEIKITGIVQGVGFRPFLFNLARGLGLKGYILNRGNAGVRLILQGNPKSIDKFINDANKKSPEISFIENLEVTELSYNKVFEKLEIKKSEKGRGISLTLPPDIAICDNCLKDMRDTKLPKYYMYPFIACAVCGPRYTTVKELPYDRERSTMLEFPFCNNANPRSCIEEYSDFNNRRFHAQTFACSVCGPNYKLYNKSKEVIKEDSIQEILRLAAKKINEGEVAAVKGIGGVHLVCLADNDDVILKLRKRKGGRKYKPFALMLPNLKIVENFLKISQRERDLLTSFRRPIVLLERKDYENESIISELVAPGLNNIGVMLPYSGIHYLLFDFIGEKPLIYTSGNKSHIPMGIDNNKIFDQLKHLADFFLLHNRTIYQRADDSVLRIHDNKIKLIRRSRGFVPEYLPLPFNVDLPAALATGPELSVTGAVLRRNRVFPTQHIGNVTHLETYDFLKDALFHMKNLLQIKDKEIKYIACDAHPLFITSKYARELSSLYNIPIYPVQHHFAHILGLMAENKIDKDEKIIGISTDGVGYGDDGNIWGGEILLSSYYGYKRLGHLEYQPMIGGDRCTKYPARMAASIILKRLGIEDSLKIFKRIELKNDLEYKETELNAIISQFKKADYHFPNENIPISCSTGRIFDTISYLLGASNLKTYRGEPAMRLEGLAVKGKPDKVNLEIKYSKKEDLYIINTSDLILEILDLIDDSKNNSEDIAASFHKAIANSFAEVAIKIARENDIYKIGLTGGVAFNYYFSRVIKERVFREGFTFLEHNLVSPGDAGISTGQLIGGLFKYYLEKS
ncbi:MAG: carbamoyltransferase HypF [Promethearchaeota archaeon]|nr:MAG: carbamoyltransferase HypF [Candidatus Lokiarchaeota archaeon]